MGFEERKMQRIVVSLFRASGRSRWFQYAASAAIATAACASSHAAVVPFTPGNIVVTRAVGGAVDTSGGGGSVGAITTANSLQGSGVAASVFIDEYTPAGVFVQSVPLPNVRNTSGSGNRALTFSGTQNTEGAITLSGDGKYFVVAGYNATAVFNNNLTTSPDFLGTNGNTSTAMERVVGLIDMNGNVNTTTALTDVSSGQAFRSAYSSNGTDIWASGGSGGAVTIGGNSVITNGIHYATVGSTTSTQLVAGVTNHRVLNYDPFRNALVVSNNSATVGVRGPNQMSGGLATTGPQTLTQLNGFQAVTAPTPASENSDDFWFKDANTLYIADQRNNGVDGGVQKWLFTDTDADTTPDTWVFQYNVTLGAQAGPATGANVGGHGLAGNIDPNTGDAILYVTSFDGSGSNRNTVFRLDDTGSASGFTASLTALVTAPDNSTFATAFRGVEIVPMVPEPASLGAIGIAVVGLLRKRSKSS
jgi:hypothetical protein